MQEKLRQDLQEELTAILDYWQTHTIDERHGGFLGKLDNDNTPDPFAVKGAVLNARILWSFSAAYNVTKTPAYLEVATRAFNYISEYFIDKEFGGVMWTVGYAGDIVDTKKQIYAQAFVVYAFSEYYKASKIEKAKEKAIGLYSLIQLYSYDCVYGGYLEAFSRDWKELEDLRLSEKDENQKKSMNTHLHVLEAYTTLYSIWADPSLKVHIQDLLNVFFDKIIDRNTNHLRLFFDEQWNPTGNLVSYGHDIEASWLLLEAAEAIGDQALIERSKTVALQMTEAAKEGIDTDGGLWYEYKPEEKQLITEKHWWPQAEAVVGFINAWQLSKDPRYLEDAINSWQYIEKNILDKSKGEWYWGIKDDKIMNEDKVGLWKCPYHNSRACLEIMKRL
ncbi:N-acyl-D-glucosamine 2-epimerase [Chitinophaga sp. SYP-B3965]|uniref:AGE family epimerase/isomerase n=1 Tax=Chitinophaga sp. SYP-B3965 TaxID=2663120 RepID=UPI0012997EA3|nr:AGE family epimerase/isomerase [Chitinophaga sp. SYP-B3965]MRG43799.1 N-acyl-D-glucosamine 2-epimerase [Chitinophaga sp. SYP-B3965]